MKNRTTGEWEEHLGHQIRAVRVAAGMSQQDLAESANLSKTSISTLERGGGSSIKTLIAVARVLNRMDWLDSFDPIGDGPSPIEQLRQRHRQSEQPQRVRKQRDDLRPR